MHNLLEAEATGIQIEDTCESMQNCPMSQDCTHDSEEDYDEEGRPSDISTENR